MALSIPFTKNLKKFFLLIFHTFYVIFFIPHISIYMCVFMYIYVCIYLCMRVYICACVCVWYIIEYCSIFNIPFNNRSIIGDAPFLTSVKFYKKSFTKMFHEN